VPPVSHPGNDYWVNPATDTIQRQSNRLLAYAAGYVLGPFTWAEAQAQLAGLKHVGTGGLSGLPGSAGQAGQAIGNAAPNIAGVAAIGDFFNRLTQPSTWIRVGEVAAGLLLLYLGLNATMQGTAAGNAVQSATKTAKRVAEVAAIPK
jgi:hypothetical protein